MRNRKATDRFTFDEADLIRQALVAFILNGRGVEGRTIAEIELANKLYQECGGHNPIVASHRYVAGFPPAGVR